MQSPALSAGVVHGQGLDRFCRMMASSGVEQIPLAVLAGVVTKGL